MTEGTSPDATPGPRPPGDLYRIARARSMLDLMTSCVEAALSILGEMSGMEQYTAALTAIEHLLSPVAGGLDMAGKESEPAPPSMALVKIFKIGGGPVSLQEVLAAAARTSELMSIENRQLRRMLGFATDGCRNRN